MYQKNEIYTVTVTDLAAEGEGIGKIDGYPLFVKDALPGDVIEARLTKVKKTYAYARMEKLLQPSPDRIVAVCPYARQCGGCQIQTLSYQKQLEYKQRKVYNNLIRLGGVPEKLLTEIMEPIIGMQPEDYIAQKCGVPVRYRNKAQYPFGVDREGRNVCGFYAGRTHDIIANTDCLLGAEENADILKAVLSYMEELHIKPYDETTKKGLIRHVLIRKSRATGQIMVCVVINGKELLQKERLIDKLTAIPGITSISISPNEKNTNVILGDTYETIWGDHKITDEIYPVRFMIDNFCRRSQRWSGKLSGKWMGRWERIAENGIRFRISPLSFYQVNPVQMERLYSTALEFVGLSGTETVWDLYCGIGTISLFLAKKAKHVYGVEVVPQAIEDARENAAINQIDNATFYVGKAEEVLPGFYETNLKTDLETNSMKHPDIIVVDPPRKGCDEGCLSTMVKMKPEKIVYVSCDPATLARDVKYLRENGYKLKRVRACDMFPNTVHVETVVALHRTDM